MMIPSPPANEAIRLHELRNTGLLDTPPDPNFDSLTELAAHVCGTPMSFISLVDDERVWLKSVYGVSLTEVPRNASFCTHVVSNGQPLQVEDATLDPRFAQTPLVLEAPKLRFYTGVPLSAANGIHFGALCVIDQMPRVLSEPQCRALSQVASAVVSQIQLQKSTILRQKLHAALNRSNDDLTTFIRAASHDLKGPLRSIMIMSEALLQGSAKTEEERAELIATIHGAASRGHRLVADLLQHTNVHLVDHQIDVDLNHVVDEVVTETADLIAERQALVAADPLPIIRGNPTVWQVILKNLIENAIKYTPSDRHPEVRITGQIDSQRLRLCVHDRACGIDAQYVDRIFKPLERLHASEISGSGIGLATVKRLVSQLQGDITVQARRPVGSTFTVDVPLSDAGVETRAPTDSDGN